MEEKKKSVLIVDDEFRIGMLIKKLIHWSALNMEYNSPYKALSFFKNQQK